MLCRNQAVRKLVPQVSADTWLNKYATKIKNKVLPKHLLHIFAVKQFVEIALRLVQIVEQL